jgi:hypothetical protein
MPTKPRLSDLSPADLRARARECRTLAEREPSTRLAESVLRLASKYEVMALKLETDQNPPSVVIWERRRESYVAFAQTPSGIEFVLNATRQPDQSWEWVVRRPGQLPAVAAGAAITVQEAMRQAEQSAGSWSP